MPRRFFLQHLRKARAQGPARRARAVGQGNGRLRQAANQLAPADQRDLRRGQTGRELGRLTGNGAGCGQRDRRLGLAPAGKHLVAAERAVRQAKKYPRIFGKHAFQRLLVRLAHHQRVEVRLGTELSAPLQSPGPIFKPPAQAIQRRSEQERKQHAHRNRAHEAPQRAEKQPGQQAGNQRPVDVSAHAASPRFDILKKAWPILSKTCFHPARKRCIIMYYFRVLYPSQHCPPQACKSLYLPVL